MGAAHADRGGAGLSRDRGRHAGGGVRAAAADQPAAGLGPQEARAMSAVIDSGKRLAVADAPVGTRPVAPPRASDAVSEPAWVRRTLIGVALAFLAIAVVMLVAAFALLLLINLLQAWARKRQGR